MLQSTLLWLMHASRILNNAESFLAVTLENHYTFFIIITIFSNYKYPRI